MHITHSMWLSILCHLKDTKELCTLYAISEPIQRIVNEHSNSLFTSWRHFKTHIYNEDLMLQVLQTQYTDCIEFIDDDLLELLVSRNYGRALQWVIHEANYVDHLDIFNIALQLGQNDIIATFLAAYKDNLDLSENSDNFMEIAIENNHVHTVKLLMEYPHLFLDNSLSLISAAAHGNTNIVQLLLSHTFIDPQDNNMAVCCAATHGHLHIVKLLVDHILQ